MRILQTAAVKVAALGLMAGLTAGPPATAQSLSAGNSAQTTTTTQPQISAYALSQIAALEAEKASRTPTQMKVDSNLLHAALIARTTATPQGIGTLSAATVKLLTTISVSKTAQPDAHGMVSVDINATVTDTLLARIKVVGGVVNGSWPAYHSIRASLPVLQLEALAASSDVRSIQPANVGHVVGTGQKSLAANPFLAPVVSGLAAPSFAGPAMTPAERRARVQAELPTLLSQLHHSQPFLAKTSLTRLESPSPSDPEGDKAQRADLARSTYGKDGTGIKIGVISDSVDGLAAEQIAGRLGTVTVLPGQSGSPSTGEGTAMLEIVNRLAPGAQLYFAQGTSSLAQFATNIVALQQAGCNIIVDDLGFLEPVFQDGIAAQAIDTVTAAGAFYFSAAGNDNNKDQDGITSTWEGDWKASGSTARQGNTTFPLLAFDAANHFANQVITVNSAPQQTAFLTWADPLAGATDDYDLYVFNSALTQVEFSSTNTQNGTQDPQEICEADQSDKILIVKHSGNGVDLHLYLTNNGLSSLTYSTAAGLYGHEGAASCYAVSAASAAIPYNASPSRTFQSTDPTEAFTSDGLRRVFFNGAGVEYTPGNRSSTGGQLRQQPVLTGSDGVTTYFSPFYGTSAAAPHDAAIAALVLSADPSLETQPTQMYSLLTTSVIPIDTQYGALPNRDAGYGILDAYVAVGKAVAAATPAASAQSVTTAENTAKGITLTGTDPNGAALTYAITTNPTHGTLSGFNASTGSVTYTPAAGYFGSDSFTFTDSNGTYTSAPATVSITVTQAAPATISGTLSVAWGSADTASVVTAADGLRLLPSGRTTDLPWLGINKLTLTLSRAAALSAGDISVTGINVANYGPVTVSGSGTTYTITLAQPISASDRVTLTVGNANIATFTRRLDVLPADVSDDGVVAAADTVLVKNAISQTFSIIDDINGDGVVDTTDYTVARAKIGTRLP